MKKCLLIVVCIFTCLSETFAQISEGGTPPSFNYPYMLKSANAEKSAYKAKIDFDVDQLLKEDKISREIAAPLRIAVSVDVNVDINKTGYWTTLPDEKRIWRQLIKASGAQGLILRYDAFYIPKGGKLFIYNEDKTQVLGAYTETTNPTGNIFSTEMIVGDKVTLEYVESNISDETPDIQLSDIGYIYNMRAIAADCTGNVGENCSDDCQININCTEGDEWRDQQRGAVKLVIYYYTAGSYSVCSGSLINNTEQDGTPYILSAHHCFEENPDYTAMQVIFNFERSGCSKTSSLSQSKTLIGTQMLVDVPLQGGSDGALIKLNNIPSDFVDNYNVYYNGWDLATTPANSGVVIHHPSGDVKKISTYNKPLVSDTYYDGSYLGYSNAHWEVTYAQTTNGKGVTEGGSSGSPIFNEKGLIVGTLTGGATYCEDIYKGNQHIGGPNESDWFGKFTHHWDKHTQKMKTYLNPLNKNVSELKGYDPKRDTGIEPEINNVSAVNLVLFPNPAYETLNINSKGIIKSISIYNLIGGLVYTDKNLNSSTAEVTVSSWNKGVYNVTVETENGTYTGKVNIR